jgi:2-keto-4-pentenoate hydratase/2-oxohepta-3-ene-1,7-dioic acid hydratase in catechol pathway
VKLLSFRSAGEDSWGVLVGEAIVDIGRSHKNRWPSLRSMLEAGACDEVERIAAQNSPTLRLDRVTLRPVIPDPTKILCIGVNYHEHRIETGRDESAHPTVFTRFANSQVAHGEALRRPMESTQFDYEGEIAIIIGRRGRRIAAGDAWQYIAGYAPYCDATLRDWQRHTSQWTPGKNFPATGGFGPYMVTRDEIEDGADLSLITRLNGIEVQRSSMALMIFGIPEILAYCSVFTELLPGDVIATGTPGGVGSKRQPPLWLKHGDSLEIEVGRVGTLRHPVSDEGGLQ